MMNGDMRTELKVKDLLPVENRCEQRATANEEHQELGHRHIVESLENDKYEHHWIVEQQARNAATYQMALQLASRVEKKRRVCRFRITESPACNWL